VGWGRGGEGRGGEEFFRTLEVLFRGLWVRLPFAQARPAPAADPQSTRNNVIASATWRMLAKLKRAMDPVREFKESLGGLSDATVRVYVAGAKAAIKAAKANASGCGSYAELLALIREARPAARARIAPFLRFLERDGQDSKLVRVEDARAMQHWVVQTLGKYARARQNPSIITRRDMALITSICVAPTKGNPRHWPKDCLKVAGSEVQLWEEKVEEPVFALALRFWFAWRERLSRPDQRRLYRKAPGWGESELLYPGPRGAPLGRAALHNALRRLLIGVGEGSRLDITPQKISVAFRTEDSLIFGTEL
jgi:hypothetical protein